MNPYFKVLNKIPPDAKALRVAIRSRKVNKVNHLIKQGTNLNGQYPDDWNTPLQVAIQEGWDEQMIQQLMSFDPDYSLVNGDDLTAAELALQRGMRSIAKQLIEAELKGFETPEEACYEMMKRNSAEAMEILLDSFTLPNQEVVHCLTKAWRRLEVMNVPVRPDVEAFVHLRLIRHDYQNILCARVDDIPEERIGLLMKDIDQFLGMFDTGLCHDISDKFLTTLREILKQLFVVKDAIRWFPTVNLEFCIAIYLAIFDRAPDLDLFRLLIHKAKIVQFLKQLRGAYEDCKNGLETRMTDALLFELVKVVLINRNQKCKHIINEWASSIGNKYKFKEQVMIKNFIAKSFKDNNISVNLYCKVSPNDKINYIRKSIEINQMFHSRRLKYKYRNLIRTYIKLKQTYSMDKVKKCLMVVESINFNKEPISSRTKVSILAVQRAIQILGETLKSTQLSPNISKALRSCLELGGPKAVFTQITELRELFSHNYSWTKHSIYERLKWNDPKLVELYKFVQADLLKLRPMLMNVCASHRQRSWNAFLGYVLQLRTADEVRVFVMECGKNLLQKFQIEHDADDINRLDEILDRLETYSKDRNIEEHYDTIAKVRSELSGFKNHFKSEKWKLWNSLLMFSVQKLSTVKSLEVQRNIARWLLNHYSTNSNSNDYGPISILRRYMFPKVWSALGFILNDTNLKKSILEAFVNLNSVNAIDSYSANLREVGERNIDEFVQISRLQLAVDENQLGKMKVLLIPYCKNVFSIDGKYSSVKKFCKDNHISYSKQVMAQSRAADVNCLQNIFEDLIKQVGEILSFSDEASEAEFVSMSASYKDNQVEIMATEMILLEILGILCERGILLDIRTLIINQRPVVTGRNLRNYLAHDSLVYDAICGNKNSNETVLLNAYYMYRYLRVNIYGQQRSRVLKSNDSVELLQIVENKHNFISTIEQGQFEKFDLKAVESKLRTLENVTVLEMVALKQPKEFLRFLLGHSWRIKPLMDILIRKSPNQRHAVHVFDLSFRELMYYEQIQSHLNSFFSTSLNRLHDLKGSQFSKESLLNSISRCNEHFALSIINNPMLYKISQKQNSRGTILTLSVAVKLFSVVRRICEVDPEMVKQTNSIEQSALHVAVMTGSLKMVRLLLKFKTPLTHSALIDALHFGMKNIFHEMMQSSNVNLLEDRSFLNDLLIAAAEANNLEVLNELLPLVDTKASFHWAVCAAILQRHFEAVRKILQYNSEFINDLDKNGYNPLIIACRIGSTKMINLLLDYGADCNLPIGRPALHSVINHAKRSIFKIFLQQGKINEKLKTSLFERCLQARNSKMALITYRACYPSNVSEENIFCMRKILPNMYHINPAVLSQINGKILGLAILYGMHTFVKHIFHKIYPRMSKQELARCLICAINANDVPMVQFLLDQGCDVNQADANGLTPLALSASLGNEELVDSLLLRGANPDLESVAYCHTMDMELKHSLNQFECRRFVTFPLIIALSKKFSAISHKLIQRGTKTEIYDFNGFSPLLVAIANGDFIQVKMLIESGANVQYAKDFIHPEYCKASVLQTVATNGHLDLFKLLVEEHGFDPLVTDSEGNTTLHTAIANKQASIVEYLLECQCWNVSNDNGQTPISLSFEYLDEKVFFLTHTKLNDLSGVHSWRSSSGCSLLHMAVLLENILLVRVLIDVFNFDSNCFDTEGFTAMHHAIRLGNLELIGILLKAGATLFPTRHIQPRNLFLVGKWLTQRYDVLCLFMCNPDFVHVLKSNHTNYILIQCAIIVDNYDSCKLLLAFNELDPNIEDKNGNSTLHLCVLVRSVRIAARLLRSGLFIDKRNAFDYTPLMLALDMNDGKMAHYLFGKGASKFPLVNYRFESNPAKTLLHWFAERGKLNSLRFLIEQKIFPCSVKDSDGRAIGHYAAANNQLLVIDYLELLRFPFDGTDNAGRSCLVCAVENGHLELAEKFLYMGSSRFIVQKYNEKKSLLKDAIMRRQYDVVEFLIENCNITPRIYIMFPS